MGSIMKKSAADKIAFKHQPKTFQIETSAVATDFVSLQGDGSSGFQISDVVAAQSGIDALRKKNIESQVEGTVLERLKEIEEQAYKQAYELGLIDGAEKAFEDKRAQFAENLKLFDEMLVNFENLKSTLLKQNEAILMKLIFQVAKRIAMHEISLQQDQVVQLLSEIMLEVQSADSVIIKMNPADLGFIEGLRAKNVKDVEKLDRVKLQAHPGLTKGGCLVETNYGEIDATVEQRVEKAWIVIESKLPSVSQDKT